MRITSVQLEIKDRPKETTLDHVLRLLEEVPPSDLILMPEIWTCGYFSFDRYWQDSESLDGPVVKVLRRKAAELGTYLLMGSMVEREDQDLFNTSLLLDPQGRIMARYRKIHLFGYRSEEGRLLKRGTEMIVVNTPWGKAGLSTCYDLRFPEFYRKMVDEGTEFFLIVSAWPKMRQEAWSLFNRVRAHENLAYLFSCNCAGVDRGFQYAGHSMFVDPLGKVLAEGGEGECIVSMDVDMGMVEKARREFSTLDDRVFK
jgi:predicted amidohydrolase